jgi:recombination protein RecA
MITRPRWVEPEEGLYFARPKQHLSFIASGCLTLDLALGGGWCERRMANITGLKSTGKTQLAIEASANFIRRHPVGMVRYRETEDAFDEPYAAALGMPMERVERGQRRIATVEDLFDDVSWCIDWGRRKKQAQLYILDSFDAVSDEDELKRKTVGSGYGAEKAKKMSELFRRANHGMSEADITFIIISQLRHSLAPFGAKYTRSGGMAIDYYASQVVQLTQAKEVRRTVNKIERVTGIKVKCKVTKNKIGLPYREAEFEITLGWGIDDFWACMDWLAKTGGIDEALQEHKSDMALERWMKSDPEHRWQAMQRLKKLVIRRWTEIENSFLVKERKYP